MISDALIQGSQNVKTLALKGAPTVPFKEGHSATRSRWSACTLTTSSVEDAERIPGLELMFKAEGSQLQGKLQAYAQRLNCPWLSVVTGPKGSYREEHVLAFLERHLLPWNESRRWRVMLMEAYGPQMSDNVRRLCWSRGYVVIIHGGGATGVTQVNDTDCHQHLRREYVAVETQHMVDESRLRSCPVPKPENCITWMASIWMRGKMHVDATRGFKYNGITNALDGSEDHLIVREAKEFWSSLNVHDRRCQALHDAQVEIAANRLAWNYEDVYKVIADFPERGILDKTVEFQDDELVLEDGNPEPLWELSDGEAEDHDGDSSSGDEKTDADVCDDDDLGNDMEDGTNHGDGAAPAANTDSLGRGASLSIEQARIAIACAAKIDSLRKALEIVKETGNPALEITLSRAIHDAEREAYGLRQSDPKVAQALHEKHVAEEKEVATKRLALNRQMEANRALQKARHETAETMAQLKRAKLQLQTAQSILETESAIKSFSVEMLGNGRNRGGGVVFRKNRMEVMDRLCKISELTGQERNHYNWFKEKWDQHMAHEHSETWGQQFAEIMQSLLQKIQGGSLRALADFMYREHRRCLADVPILRL